MWAESGRRWHRNTRRTTAGLGSWHYGSAATGIRTNSTPWSPANPCPSVIPVSGVNRSLPGIRVKVDRLSHTYPSDLDIVLERPQGPYSETLDRMVLNHPAQMFRQFAGIPERSENRGAMMANMMARGDLRDDEQRGLVNDWMTDSAFQKILPTLETIHHRLTAFVGQVEKCHLRPHHSGTITIGHLPASREQQAGFTASSGPLSQQQPTSFTLNSRYTPRARLQLGRLDMKWATASARERTCILV